MVLRRLRGSLLRLVRQRALAILVGLLLVAPALWLEFGPDVPWWAGGAGLVLGATGLALLWTGLVGVRPDWIDRD
jgi:hypothetical protein